MVLHHHGQPHGVRATRLLVTLVFISGRLLEAARANQQLRDLSAKGNYRYAWVWSVYLDGLIAFYRSNLDAAIGHFSSAVEERYIVHTRAAVDAMTGLALAYQALRRPKEAHEALEQLREYVAGQGAATG